MHVVVTGGAGFVGSHVCERLLREEHRVTVIDDLNAFYSPQLKRGNLAGIASAGDFQFHESDICDERRVLDIFSSTRPETVIHLAARAGVRPSLEHPLLYERVNVQGTLVLLEACRRFGVRKFVFASSSSIYGNANKVPFCEEDHLNLPLSPYAATKIAGEKICYTYSHLYGLQVISLRLFTVFGPRQRPDLAIRKFTEQIDAGLPVSLFGDLSSARDYTFVDDIVQGFMAALSYDCEYEVFNLGNSSPVSLAELIPALEASLGKKADVRRLPAQPGDVPITYADISKATALLGYHPQTGFHTGIRRFVSWYLERKAAVAA